MNILSSFPSKLLVKPTLSDEQSLRRKLRCSSKNIVAKFILSRGKLPFEESARKAFFRPIHPFRLRQSLEGIERQKTHLRKKRMEKISRVSKSCSFIDTKLCIITGNFSIDQIIRHTVDDIPSVTIIVNQAMLKVIHP